MASKTITPERAAEWMVQLNMWQWPEDLPGKPNPPGGLPWREERAAIRGAYAALEASGVPDMKLVDEIWQDEDRRQALISPLRE